MFKYANFENQAFIPLLPVGTADHIKGKGAPEESGF